MKTYLLVAVGFLSVLLLEGCSTTQCSTCAHQQFQSRSCSQTKVNSSCSCADVACTYYGYDCFDPALCCRVFGNIGAAWNDDADESQDDTDYSYTAPESAFSSYSTTTTSYTTRPIHYKGEG